MKLYTLNMTLYISCMKPHISYVKPIHITCDTVIFNLKIHRAYLDLCALLFELRGLLLSGDRVGL